MRKRRDVFREALIAEMIAAEIRRTGPRCSSLWASSVWIDHYGEASSAARIAERPGSRAGRRR